MEIETNRFIAQRPEALSESIFNANWGSLEGNKTISMGGIAYERQADFHTIKLFGRELNIERIRYQPDITPIKTILIVPGAGHPACLYEPLARILATQGIAVQLYSAPGTGLTTTPRFFQFMGIRHMVRIGNEILNHMPDKEVILVGHSLGGIIARIMTKHESGKKILGMGYISSMGDEGSLRAATRAAVQDTGEFIHANAKVSLSPLYLNSRITSRLFFNDHPDARAFNERIGTLSYRTFIDLLNPVRTRLADTPAALKESFTAVPRKDRTVLPVEQLALARKFKWQTAEFREGAHDLFLLEQLPELAETLGEWAIRLER